MKELNNHIKNGAYKNLYLFYGEEPYLKKFYEDKLKEKILPPGMEMMNLDTFEGKNADVDAIWDAVSTLPFMSDYRLVVVKNSGLFAPGRKDDTKKAADLAKDVIPSAIVIFIEENVDKRNGLYKKCNELGHAVEFKTPKESELVDWAAKMITKKGVKIAKSVAAYFVRTVAYDMSTIELEAEKLTAYKNGEGSISTEDIDLICTRSLETRIFDLVDALGNKQPQKAVDIYQNLLLLKESPVKVLTMIARQLRLILQCKDLMETAGMDEIAQRLGIRSFVARECMKQSGNFSKNDLIHAVKDCLHTDINIKTGKMGDKLAVEVLIVKYAS